jgi:anti-sigma factor RsiW
MADHLRPLGGPTCDDVRGDLELLAIGALDPADRAVLEAHLRTCPECRAAVASTEAAVSALLLLAPAEDLPPGFADRVVAGMTEGSGATEASGVPEPIGAPEPTGRAARVGPSRWTAVAVACVVVLLVVAAATALLGRDDGGDRADGSPPTAVAPRSAPLVTSSGAEVGSVAVDDGDPATLAMALDLVVPGVAYDCVVRSEAGELVTVGSWTARSGGSTSWSVVLDPALGRVDEVQLVVPGAAPVATAHLT